MIEIGPNLQNALIWTCFWIFMTVTALRDGPWFAITVGDKP